MPHDFDIPPLYLKADPPTVAEALRLGAETYKTVVTMKSSDEAKAIQAQHATEVQHIRDQMAAKERALIAATQEAEDDRTQLLSEHRQARAAQEQKIAQLQESLQHQKALQEQTRQATIASMSEAQTSALVAARTEERGRIQAQLDSAMNQLKEDMATKDARIAAKEAHIQALVEQQQQLQILRDADIQKAEERTRQALKPAMEEIQKTVERLEREKERLTCLFDTQSAALNALTEQLSRKPTSSKAKGDAFEEQIVNELYETFGMCDGYELIHTATRGIGHEGDIFMKLMDNKTMWETKDYGKDVDTKEITKFKRDICENKDVSVAVMISKYTKIVGKTSHGDLDIEFYNGVMCIYISRYELMAQGTLRMLLLLFRLFWQNKRTLEMDDSKQTHMRIIMELQKTAEASKTEWILHKSRMEDAVSWMGRLVKDNYMKLQNAVNVLNGTTVVDAPTTVFKDCAGNEKETALLQKILRVVKVEPESSVALNDLADLIKGELTAGTVAKHIRSLVLPEALEQKSGDKIRINGLALTVDMPHIIQS